MNIEEIIGKKEMLEKNITTLIRAYEEQTKTHVYNIDLESLCSDSDRYCSVVHTFVEVRL